MPRPTGEHVITFEASLEGDAFLLSYRDRASGHGATLRLTKRGALNLARLLDGTRIARDDRPATTIATGELLEHA
jgi:hypothetical protein